MSPALAPAATPRPTGVPWLNAGPSRLKLKDRTGAIKRYPRAARPRWACLSFNLSVMGGSQERPLMTQSGHSTWRGSMSPNDPNRTFDIRPNVINAAVSLKISVASWCLTRSCSFTRPIMLDYRKVEVALRTFISVTTHEQTFLDRTVPVLLVTL